MGRTDTPSVIMAVLLAPLILPIAACSSAPADGGAQGVVTAAISSTGPDGATYSLPSSATLTLAEAGGMTGTIPLSTSAVTESFSVAAGSYAATLSSGVDSGTRWTLTRAADGGVTSLPAVLMDPQPYLLTVTKGTTTPLVFHFATQTLGDVIFSTGAVVTSTTLDAGSFPISRGTVTGTASMSVEMLAGSSTFNSAFNFTGTSSVPYSLKITRTGAWTYAADSACAPVGVTASSTASRGALAAIVDETSGGSGNLCFGDTNLTGQFVLSAFRTGSPTTTTMKTSLPAGGTFELLIIGYAPEVFSSGTLRLSKLGEPFTVTSVGVSEVVSANGVELANIGSAPNGKATVTLSP